MKLVATVSSPLKIIIPRKTKKDKSFILNLNVYRNTNRFTLNDVKIDYKKLMQKQIETLPKLCKVAVRFILYPRTHRKTDTPNVCSIHDKFFMDALVEFGKLTDDTFEHYVETSYKFGAVDKLNPRVDIEIYEL
jgi:hypothetical protein